MTDDVTDATRSAAAHADPPGETDPRYPTWLRRAALRVRDALTDDRILVLMLLADLVTVLGASAIWLALGGEPTTVGVTAGALLAFAAAMLPLIRRRDANGEQSLWPPFVLAVIPLAVLLVGLPAWGARAYLDSRPVDVTQDIELEPDEGPLGNGGTVVATLRTDTPRPRLGITFAVREHDREAPVCAPGSGLTVTSQAGSVEKHARIGAARTAEFTFDLVGKTTDIRLAILLKTEKGCELDLSVVSAQLDG